MKKGTGSARRCIFTPIELRLLAVPVTFFIRPVVRRFILSVIGALEREGAAVRELIRTVVRVLGFSTAGARSDKVMAAVGVQGFVVCPPCGKDLSQDTIRAQLASTLELDLPTALYQLPQVTSNEMSPETVGSLAAEYGNAPRPWTFLHPDCTQDRRFRTIACAVSTTCCLDTTCSPRAAILTRGNASCFPTRKSRGRTSGSGHESGRSCSRSPSLPLPPTARRAPDGSACADSSARHLAPESRCVHGSLATLPAPARPES